MAQPMNNDGFDYSDTADDVADKAQEAVNTDIDLAKRGRSIYNNYKSAHKAADAAKAAGSALSGGDAGAAGAGAGAIGAGGAGAGAGAGAGTVGGTAAGTAAGTAGTSAGVSAAVANWPITLIVIVVIVIVLIISAFADQTLVSRPVSNASITNTGFETYETQDPETGKTVTRIRVSSETTDKQVSLIQKAVENVENTLKPSYDEVVQHAAGDEQILNRLNQRITGLSDSNAFYYEGDGSNAPKANTYDKDGNQRKFSCDLKPSDVSYNSESQSGTMDTDYCHISYHIGPDLNDEAQMMVAYAQSVTGLLGQYPSTVREHGANAIANDYDLDETDTVDSKKLGAYLSDQNVTNEDELAAAEQAYYADNGNEYTSIASSKFAESLIDEIGENPFFAPADPAKWTINSTETKKKYAAKYTVSHRTEETHTESYVDEDPLSLSHGATKYRTVTKTKWVEDDTVYTDVWDSAEDRSNALKDTSDTRYKIKQSYEYLYEVLDASIPIYYDISSYKEDELSNVQDYMLQYYRNEDSAVSESDAQEAINTVTTNSMNTYWTSYVGTYIDFAAIAGRLAPYFGEISPATIYAGADRGVIAALSYGYDGTYSGPSIGIIAESHGGSGSADYAITGEWAAVSSYCRQHGLYFMDHQCTDFVRYSAHQMYGIVTHGNGNEVVHYLVAEHPDMFVLSSTPAPGAIISIKRTSDDTSSPGYKYGHTAIVLSVDLDNDLMTIAEGNYGSQHAIVSRTVSISGYYPGLVVYAVPIQ